MKTQRSSRDWEILSAYLDRQLNQKDTARLETRLGSDPQLSAALGELQRTRDVLRSLPKLRAPRNFTLTPQMVGQSSQYRPRAALKLAPVFGFASALATFLLILVVVGEMTGILTTAARPVAEAPAITSEIALMVAPTQVESPQAVEEQATKQSAPREAEALMLETEAVPEEPPLLMQAEPAPETITDTAGANLAMEAQPPMTDTLTINAKEASGMGGGMAEASGEYPPPGEPTFSAAEGSWTTVVEVTISPTQTLTFPMTVTIEGSSTTEIIDTLQDTEAAPDALPQSEDTALPGAEKALVPEEAYAPEATSTPEALALLDPTPTPSKPELQLQRPAEDTLAENSAETAGTNKAALRILEISLAGLALVLGLVGIYLHWGRRR